MSRTYFHCGRCRKRMRKFDEDTEKGQVFYLCPACGDRATYLPSLNGWSDGWPQEAFDDAVRCGVLTKKGRVL